MKKNNVCLLLLAFSCFVLGPVTAFADTASSETTAAETNSADEKKIEKSGDITFGFVCKSLSSHKIVTGDFVQLKKLAKLKRSFTSSGTFIIDAANGIAWNTQKPFKSIVVLTKTKIVQTAADGTVSVMDASQNQTFADIAETLSSVFSGNESSLTKNFTVQFTAQAGDSIAYTIVLTPKDSTVASVVSTITLGGSYMSKDCSCSLDYISLKEKSGDGIVYNFTNQKYDEKLTDEQKLLFAK